MTLANCAFLAAQNGKKVLVMDWDLEAPGLPYYFKGLHEEVIETKAIKDAEGILNLVWDWRNAMTNAKTTSDVDAAIERLSNDTSFVGLRRPLVAKERLPENAALDLIKAGSSLLRDVEGGPLIKYETALSELSWHDFFDNMAGGRLLEKLRAWAKENYDLIFVDSRTGFADVAGICTMQLPDLVVLCFVLNRQNIDGISRVAAAIRGVRQPEVEIHAAPMRVARSGTSEENDAKAYAMRELVRVGGFTSSEINDDFSSLSVPRTESVPYYEALSVFMTDDPRTDPLTITYCKLITRLTGIDIVPTEISSSWIEIVKSRQQPRLATLDYLNRLKLAEPERAEAELEALVQALVQEQADDYPTSPDYVRGLSEALRSFSSSAELSLLHSQLVELCRELTVSDQQKWETVLLDEIEFHIEEYDYSLGPSETQVLLEEFDAIIAKSNTVPDRIRRLRLKRQACVHYLRVGNYEAVKQTIGEIRALIDSIKRTKAKLSESESEMLMLADAETHAYYSDVSAAEKKTDEAIQYALTALQRLPSFQLTNESIEVGSLRFDIHVKLARLYSLYGEKKQAAEQAVRAAQTAPMPFRLAYSFMELARIVADDNRNADNAVQFIRYTLDSREQLQSFIANHLGRQPQSVVTYLSLAASISTTITSLERAKQGNVIDAICQLNVAVSKTLLRRKNTIKSSLLHQIGVELMTFRNRFSDSLSESSRSLILQTALEFNARPQTPDDKSKG